MAGFVGPEIPGVTDGLAAYFDAALTYPGSGNTWNSGVGNITATLRNGPTFLNEYGGILSYDGADDDCIIEHNDLSYNRENFTCEVWANYTANHSNWETSPFSKWNTGGGTSNEWLIGVNNSGGPSTFLFVCQSPQNTGGNNNKGDFPVSSTTNYSTNTWYHMVGTFDGANSTVKLYINGTLEGSRTDFNDTEVKTVSSTRFWIGGFEVRQTVLADIAVAKLYNKTLTSTEVSQNYKAFQKRFNL